MTLLEGLSWWLFTKFPLKYVDIWLTILLSNLYPRLNKLHNLSDADMHTWCYSCVLIQTRNMKIPGPWQFSRRPSLRSKPTNLKSELKSDPQLMPLFLAPVLILVTVKSRAVDRSTIQFWTILEVLLIETCYYVQQSKIKLGY